MFVVYENRTIIDTQNVEASSSAAGSAALTASLGLGHYVMQGIDGATITRAASLTSLSKTAEQSTPTVPVVDSYYTGQLLSNSIWHLFTSKTVRPITPISWASPMPEVEKCWSDIVTWRSSSISWWNKYVASTKFSNTVLTTETTIWAVTETAIETTIYPTSVSAYTLCDGSPRANIRPQTSTITSNVTKSRTLVVPQEFAFPQPQPCIPDSHTCRLWYYSSDMNVTNEDELLQQCGRPTGLYEPCLVAGGPVQLIYWPEGNGESDICPNNASMVLGHPSQARKIPATTLPETITTLGHTFTSGSVYLSFHTLYASYDGFWDRVGPTFKDTIIPVPSSALSTHCGGFTEAHGPGTALNYADLNWPVAASAYNCQARCDNWRFVSHDNRSASAPECRTIWNDVNPNIVVPTLVRDLVPEWAHCEMSGFRIPNFWHDPPVALTMEASMAMPTAPHAESTQEPALPSPTIASGVPIETGLIDGDAAGSLSSSTEAQPLETSTQGDRTTEVEATIDSQPPKTSKYDDPTPAEHESSTVDSGVPRPEHTAGFEVVVPPGPSDPVETGGGDPKSTKVFEPPSTANDDAPLETLATNTLFSYQPESTSLDALSVLQSALSTFSEQSHVTQSASPTTATRHDGEDTSDSTAVNSDSSHAEDSSGVPPTFVSTDDSRSQVQSDATGHADATGTTSTTVSEGPQTSGNDDPTMATSSQPAQESAATTGVSKPASSSEDDSTEMTLPVVVQAPSAGVSTLVAGDLTVTASPVSSLPDAVVLGSHTFHPDDPVATISGHVISAISSGFVLVSSDAAVTFTEISANSDHSLVPLVAGSLTVTAEVAEGSSGAISVGGTTLAKDGDFATLQDGHTLRFNPSGIEVVQSNMTVLMSTASETEPTAATTSTSTPSRTMEYPTESIETADSAGEKNSRCSLETIVAIMLVAMYATCWA